MISHQPVSRIGTHLLDKPCDDVGYLCDDFRSDVGGPRSLPCRRSIFMEVKWLIARNLTSEGAQMTGLCASQDTRTDTR